MNEPLNKATGSTTSLRLYSGHWPSNPNKTAKYSVKYVDGDWKVTVLYDCGEGERFLAVDGDRAEVTSMVNQVKSSLGQAPGGVFYVNEYRHIVVPVAHQEDDGTRVHCYAAGKLESDFTFQFEGSPLSGHPVRPDGSPLQPGEKWHGPRPGVAYKLAAGASDIYFESPALTEDPVPRVRANVRRKVRLSKALSDAGQVARAVEPIRRIRDHSGGRFFVNEHGAMFTPTRGERGGVDYTFCGVIDPAAWFPAPQI